jgi:CBS domain-containing protein
MALLSAQIRVLNLRPPPCVASGTSVREVIETVQRYRMRSVLICAEECLLGIMTERDVLMKIVARDVNYDEPVDKFMSPNPGALTLSHTIGDAISLMSAEGFRDVPVVDAKTAEPIALLRVRDVIDYLAESFPHHVINLPPRPDQTMKTAEGA